MSESPIHELAKVSKAAKDARMSLSRKLAQGDYSVGILANEISDAQVRLEYVGDSPQQIKEALLAERSGDPSTIERHAYVHLTLGAWDGEHQRLQPLTAALEKYVIGLGMEVASTIHQGVRIVETSKGKERRDAYVEVDVLNPTGDQLKQLESEFSVIGRGVEEPIMWR